MKAKQQTSQNQRLGAELESLDRFLELDVFFKELESPAFRAQPAQERFKQVNKTLLTLIQKTQGPAFLLGALLEFMERVNQAQLLETAYSFKDFEFWLNHDAGLDKKEKALLCAKIAGRYIPREDYQYLFPIGMNRTYPGNHFVAAHLSPDIDTTVASFWGWVDAFAARVSEGLHIWFLPGGPPESYFTNYFKQLFGKQSFALLAKETGRLALEEKFSSASGTVSLRDFSNEDETLMSPNLQIISVVDHHKIALKTTQPPLLMVADVQSSNVLLAEVAFELNDGYSLGGLTPEQIKSQVEGGLATTTAQELRLYQKRLKRLAALHRQESYFVHPKRESAEYLFFLYAILDDTDLLAKAGHRDLYCVAELLNRLLSLGTGRDEEVVHFDDIPKDESFVAKATERLLKNDDLYQIYKRLYSYQEEGLSQKIANVLNEKDTLFFADTKEQSGCARVGQAKIFSSTHAEFQEKAHALRKRWLEFSQAAHKQNPQVDLHLSMISTISGADEVYKGLKAPQGYQDEIWLWMPDTKKASEHLATFLSLFKQSKEVLNSKMNVELCGPKGKELEALFGKSFGSIPLTVGKESFGDERVAILRFNPGAINSRKASITPYLPKH